MGYSWVDHTAELELHIDATSEDAVFGDALEALAELVRDGRRADQVSFDVSLTAPDRATLLAGWLDELVFRAEVDGLVPDAIEHLELDDDRVEATVRGHRGEPRHIVKGVTYHRLAFEREGEHYRACIVLDV